VRRAAPERPQGSFPSVVDRMLPPRDPDLARAWRIVSAMVVASCCVVVLWVLHPSLLLRDTTPNGGDLGAHVWFPAFLRDHLLPHWRVAGWSNDWFGGFPAGQFYFPLPALVTVALDLLLPYNVALKLTTALGPVLMPAGAYAFGRGLRLRRPGPELLSVATVLFLFFKGIEAIANSPDATIQFNQRIMGGPLVSALAGEYSFSLARALAHIVMSHVVVGIFVAVGAVIIVAVALTTRWARRALLVAGLVGATAALVTAFWTLPLVSTFGYTANMRYEKLTTYVDYLFIDEFVPYYVLAVIGLALAVAFRDRAELTVALLAGVWAPVFVLWPELHAWNLRFLPFWYLGIFFVAAIGVAEVLRRASSQFARLWVGPAPGVDETYDVPDELSREGRLYRVVHTVTVLSVVAVLTTGAIWWSYGGRGFLDFWAKWNETGYENAATPGDAQAKAKAQKQYGEYRALIDRLAKLPPGRAMWEGGPSIDAYGTPLALMLLPYWTDGRIQSFEGLYYESAASTPYVFMMISPLSASENSSDPVRGLDYLDISRFADGVRYLRALGGRYYLAHSSAAKRAADADPGLRFLSTVADRDGQPPEAWNIYEVRDHALVAPLKYEPVVVTPKSGTQAACFDRPAGPSPGPEIQNAWECTAVGWWSHPERLDEPLAADGPASWARASAAAAPAAARRELPAVEVTDVHETDDDISFRVSRPGVPVVVRTSYFPNWEATGADGPWRLTPNLMVVVPTGHRVHLHFARSGAERLGGLLSLLGLVGLVGLVVWDRRKGPIGPGSGAAHPARGPETERDEAATGTGSTVGGGGPAGSMVVPPGGGGEDPRGPGP
jgi:hypothetical protein